MHDLVLSLILVKKNRYRTIVELQQEIGASEKGKDSGIIAMSYEHKIRTTRRKST